MKVVRRFTIAPTNQRAEIGELDLVAVKQAIFAARSVQDATFRCDRQTFSAMHEETAAPALPRGVSAMSGLAVSVMHDETVPAGQLWLCSGYDGGTE